MRFLRVAFVIFVTYKLRILSLHIECEMMGKFLDHRPLVIWPNGNNNVKPFSAGALDETLEPHFRKPSFEFASCFRQSLPFDRQHRDRDRR